MPYGTEVPVGEVVRTSPSWVLPPTHPQPGGPLQEGHRLGHTASPCLVAWLVTGTLLTPEDDLDKDPPTSSLSASPRGRYSTTISHPLQLYQVLSPHPFLHTPEIITKIIHNTEPKSLFPDNMSRNTQFS